MLKQSGNIYHTHTSCHPFQPILIHIQILNPYQLSICISYQYHASLIPTISFKLHAKFIPNPSFTIHESHHSYTTIHHIFLPQQLYPSKCQPSKNKKQPNTTLPSPSSSLRLKGLAQASPLRLDEGSKRGTITLCGISLRRDPSRLSETFTRSKQRRSPERLRE